MILYIVLESKGNFQAPPCFYLNKVQAEAYYHTRKKFQNKEEDALSLHSVEIMEQLGPREQVY